MINGSLLSNDSLITWRRRRSIRRNRAAEREAEAFIATSLEVLKKCLNTLILYLLAHESLYADFQTQSAEDIGDYDALRELVYLYNHWQQLLLWNCPSSGYGNDPLDATDATGETCTNANKKATFKCRIQFQFDILFDRVFKQNTLDW